jgi:hypothetical protein
MEDRGWLAGMGDERSPRKWSISPAPDTAIVSRAMSNIGAINTLTTLWLEMDGHRDFLFLSVWISI